MLTTLHYLSHRTACAALGLCLAIGSALIATAAEPTVDVQRDASGAKITWDATDGMDYILEGTDDTVGGTWTQVNQSVVQEGSLNRVFVPEDQAKAFYRLVDDGRIQAAYVGSETCQSCHPTKYADFMESGHSYKLVKVEGAPPTYFSDQQVHVPNPPDSWTWDDISWVIGGALWKARFIDQDGYIITGTNVQYNLDTQGWVGYHSDEAVGTKPYNCGACHTTGWVAVGSGGVSQDGQPGMHGSFAAPGVHCEACHGPGSRHAATMSASDIIRDDSSALCGQCHIRGASDMIPASGGFIRHHEQYNEILSAGHANLKCVTCHDAHISSKRELPGALIRNCTDCHDAADYEQDFHSNFAECQTCHLPRASKSAVAVNKYVGDVKTHIFKINPNADGEMFTPDDAFANGATGVTLSYVCYRCHKDQDGVGGNNSTKSLSDLQDRAMGFHQ